MAATNKLVTIEKSNSVLQQSSANNLQQRQVIFLRKTLPSDPSKKQSPTMTRVSNPPPVAVARRNARERNRVKQVNNGFATLRQHIPTAIASNYESGSGRGGNKKLSKVETLRMAVDYIKSLEKLLNLSEDNTPNSPGYNHNSSNNSASSSHNQFTTNSLFDLQDDDENDRLHLRKNYLYAEDEENIHPLKMEDVDHETINLVNVNPNLELLHSMDNIDNNASLSPEVYSESSLSPTGLDHSDVKSYIPVFNVPININQNTLPSFAQLAYERIPQVKSELLSPNRQQTVEMDNLHSPDDNQTVCIITRNDIVNEHDQFIDVMLWGQAQSIH